MNFLELIDASPVHAFTTRTKDRKDLTRVFYGTYATLEQKLRIFNEELDADIWFTVNRTNGTGRTAADITHLRAFFVDCDKGPPAAWPLPPSIVVESSPDKVQAYWLIEPLEATKESVEKWENIESSLVTFCAGDEAAKDVARVLRLPGFANCKYPARPAVKVLSADRITYTCEDLYAVLPTPAPRQKVLQSVTGGLQDEDRRATRYRTWLDAITDAPQPGGGKRNAFFFKKAAHGVRDLGLPAESVAEILSEYAVKWYGDVASYDEEKLYEIASNAARHGKHSVGSAAQLANVVLDMTEPTPITKNQVSSPDDKAKKMRALALRAKAELAGRFMVITDDKGRISYGVSGGPGVIIPCDPIVIINEMIVRYGAEVLASRVKQELLPTWASISDKVSADDIKPFIFASEQGSLAFQRLRFDPDPSVSCPTTFKEMLTRTTPEEARSLILWIGSLLDYKSPRTQYMYLWGEGNDGKSTLISAIMSVFSAQGVALMRSDDMGVHGTTRLEGARLICFVDENTTRFVSSGVFKSITGDDTMTVNPKGQPFRNIKVFAKVIIASNNSPALNGGTADYRRILPVHFKSYRDINGDQNFVERMLEEAQPIMQYCYSQFAEWKAANPNVLIPAAPERIEEVKSESKEAADEDTILGALDFSDPNALTSCTAIKNRLGKDGYVPRYVTNYFKRHRCKSVVVNENGKSRRYWRGIKLVIQ